MLLGTRVVVRGGGELASAVAALLFRCGFSVTVLELPAPLAVRRLVSFAEAVRIGEVLVEGVRGRLCDVATALEPRGDAPFVKVLVDPHGEAVEQLRPEVLVDGRMAKRNLGTARGDAPIVIGLGPGFDA